MNLIDELKLASKRCANGGGHHLSLNDLERLIDALEAGEGLYDQTMEWWETNERENYESQEALTLWEVATTGAPKKHDPS